MALKTIGLRVTDEMWAKYERLAKAKAKRGLTTTQSEEVRRAMAQYLEMEVNRNFLSMPLRKAKKPAIKRRRK